MLVGEQPGNEEDLQGHPFVSPAGVLLDKLLADAGLPRQQLYVTNAVKHFSFTERGKRRLHKKPTTSEIIACKPWLLAEIEAVRPSTVLALGATAAFSLFGSKVRLTRDRGQWLTVEVGASTPVRGMVTFHPSAILRAPTPERRLELRALLTADLVAAASRRTGTAARSAIRLARPK
jgi:uracil-DNA glycosylase